MVGLVLLLVLFSPSSSHSARVSDPCASQLPVQLVRHLKDSHPKSRIVSLGSLEPYHQGLYRKENVGLCPGVARGDFFGTGQESFAIVLVEGRRPEAVYRLIAVRPDGKNGWTSDVLQEVKGDSAPAVFAEGPGHYESISDDTEVTSSHPVIHLVGYESWGIIFSWNGTGFEKVWV